jgi:hypothetical protein
MNHPLSMHTKNEEWGEGVGGGWGTICKSNPIPTLSKVKEKYLSLHFVCWIEDNKSKMKVMHRKKK